MKMLSNEVKTLLDKLYNLRGEDSVILAKMNKEREEAIETTERTKNEKEVLLESISKLTREEEVLQEEGKKLTSILSDINRDDFVNVLDRLQIDFNPEAINEKINKMLPGAIEKVVNENKKASEKLESVESEMNNAITKVEELGIRKDEALKNQTRLNEYFNLALEGNINITRDAITSLLEKFDFTVDEQREAAKILMFPEDALYEYDAQYKSGKIAGKTITEVLVEAKSKTEEKEVIEENHEEIKESLLNNTSLEDIFDKVIVEEKILDEEKEDVEKPTNIEVSPIISEEEPILTEATEEVIDIKFDTSKLNEEQLNKVKENEELVNKNVDILEKYKIDLSIIDTNLEILFDTELEEKLARLIEVGKEARDIALMPSILVKYNLEGLNNTINVLKVSGLDPKVVPLMAY